MTDRRRPRGKRVISTRDEPAPRPPTAKNASKRAVARIGDRSARRDPPVASAPAQVSTKARGSSSRGDRAPSDPHAIPGDLEVDDGRTAPDLSALGDEQWFDSDALITSSRVELGATPPPFGRGYGDPSPTPTTASRVDLARLPGWKGAPASGAGLGPAFGRASVGVRAGGALWFATQSRALATAMMTQLAEGLARRRDCTPAVAVALVAGPPALRRLAAARNLGVDARVFDDPQAAVDAGLIRPAAARAAIAAAHALWRAGSDPVAANLHCTGPREDVRGEGLVRALERILPDSPASSPRALFIDDLDAFCALGQPREELARDLVDWARRVDALVVAGIVTDLDATQQGLPPVRRRGGAGVAVDAWSSAGQTWALVVGELTDRGHARHVRAILIDDHQGLACPPVALRWSPTLGRVEPSIAGDPDAVHDEGHGPSDPVPETRSPSRTRQARGRRSLR